jgi:hypothetical protein
MLLGHHNESATVAYGHVRLELPEGKPHAAEFLLLVVQTIAVTLGLARFLPFVRVKVSKRRNSSKLHALKED